MSSTAALHGLGLLLGSGLHKKAAGLRAIGILIIASGGWMMVVA